MVKQTYRKPVLCNAWRSFGRKGAHKRFLEPLHSHKCKEPCGSHKRWAPLKRKESGMRSDSGLEVGSWSESASLDTGTYRLKED